MSNVKDKKVLVQFSIPKEIEKEISDETQNEKGETVITKRKEKQTVNYKYAVWKPWRSLREDVEVYNACEYGKALHGGAMSAVLLEKRYNQDEGIFSKQELDERTSLYEKLLENNKRLIELKDTATPDPVEVLKLETENNTLIGKIQQIEAKTQGIFNNSAERISRDRSIVYYLLYLAAKDDGGKFVEYVSGKNFEEKRAALDVIEEDGDEHDIKVFSIFLTIITIWMTNGKVTQEDVDLIVRDIS